MLDLETTDQIPTVPTVPAGQSIIAIDPGIANLGLAVITSQGHRLPLLAATKRIQTEENSRLAPVFSTIIQMIREHSPIWCVAIEQTHWNQQEAYRGGKSLAGIHQAVGTILLTAELAKVPVVWYASTTISATCLGYGKLKSPEKKLAAVELGQQVYPQLAGRKPKTSQHEYDAVLVALCAGAKAGLPVPSLNLKPAKAIGASAS